MFNRSKTATKKNEKEPMKSHQEKRDENRLKVEDKILQFAAEKRNLLKRSGVSSVEELETEYKKVLNELIKLRCEFCNSAGHRYRICPYKKNIDCVFRVKGLDKFSKLLAWYSYNDWVGLGRRGD